MLVSRIMICPDVLNLVAILTISGEILEGRCILAEFAVHPCGDTREQVMDVFAIPQAKAEVSDGH